MNWLRRWFTAQAAEEQRRIAMWRWISVNPRTGVLTRNMGEYLSSQKGQEMLAQIAAIRIASTAGETQ